MRLLESLPLLGLVGVMAGCSTFMLAPGAADVVLTKTPANVVGCTTVGNVRAPQNAEGRIDVQHAARQLQNQTLGLGGNVAFLTEGSLRFPRAGVAYRCAKVPTAGT